jgi:hypothetical protein
MVLNPADWHFWFWGGTDTFAGEFWEMVENTAELDCLNKDLDLPIPKS